MFGNHGAYSRVLHAHSIKTGWFPRNFANNNPVI